MAVLVDLLRVVSTGPSERKTRDAGWVLGLALFT
jgi:hypothetical protein